ncbi:SCO2/SenC family protein [Capnocytophaga sp. oral taxon 338 str. F0234]|nr:SCO2/SenC family protein [Capnocytophaga sp. oral taxon 338 str. F0234]
MLNKTIIVIKTKETILKKSLIRTKKLKSMSRQLNFYATNTDRKIISDILRQHFGEMIEVLSSKDSLQLFENTEDKKFYLLTDVDGKEHITYREHTLEESPYIR